MKAGIFRVLINLWPPFLLTGIHCTRISADFREADVRLSDRLLNRNPLGTHFGGSLYAMVDPWYVMLLVSLLGREYIVWDKSATIDFLAPARGTVRARFRLEDGVVDEILARTREGDKFLPEFQVEVTDETGEVVARVRKELYVRRKRATAPTAEPAADR